MSAPALVMVRFPGRQVVHIAANGQTRVTLCGIDFAGQPTLPAGGHRLCRTCEKDAARRLWPRRRR